MSLIEFFHEHYFLAFWVIVGCFTVIGSVIAVVNNIIIFFDNLINGSKTSIERMYMGDPSDD